MPPFSTRDLLPQIVACTPTWSFQMALIENKGKWKAHWVLNHLSPQGRASLWHTFYWSKWVTWPRLDTRGAGKCSVWQSSCSSAIPYRKGTRIFMTDWAGPATYSKAANDHIVQSRTLLPDLHPTEKLSQVDSGFMYKITQSSPASHSKTLALPWIFLNCRFDK